MLCVVKRCVVGNIYYFITFTRTIFYVYTVYVYEKKEYKKDTLFFNIKIIPL